MWPAPKRYESIGLTLSPPPNSPGARITARQAYDICNTAGLCPHVDSDPTSYLAIATRTLPGQDHTPRLVYVLRWENVLVFPAGPPRPDADQPVSAVCLIMVDATTGELWGTYLTNAPDE